jgi:hypothetical protein
MFTMAQMREKYAEHGDRLVMLGDEPGEVYSANPGDYWYMSDSDTFPGELALRVPERFEVIA